MRPELLWAIAGLALALPTPLVVAQEPDVQATAPVALADGPAHAARLRDELARLESEIESEASYPLATDKAQCRRYALGHSPCGGPERYLAYSALRGNEPRVRDLVLRYNQLSRQVMSAARAEEGCTPLAGPELVIEDSVCRLRTPAAD